MIPTPAASALALHGGSPVRTRPFPAWPHFAEDEITAVLEVMRSGRVNYWTGEQGREFEQEFAAWCGTRHAVAVANGTVALELALRSLGIGPEDEVIVASRTFVASASCIALCGARPVFADVDPNSQNVTAETIESVLTPATRAIIAVHLAGWPCHMRPILELARKHNILVVEDCAQAQGATYNGRRVGSFGDAAAFSFCHDKIMTTLGEGGMLVTGDSEVHRRACAFKDHGKSDATAHNGRIREKELGGFRWVHDSLGTNWRMTEVQATVGRLQLQGVDAWLNKRRSHAARMCRRLSPLEALRIPVPPAEVGHAFYRWYAFVRPEKLKSGWNRDRILAAIRAEGVPCSAGSCSEVYLEKAFAEFRPASRLSGARELGESSLAFLTHPTLNEDDIDATCEAVEKVMQAASSSA